VDSTVLYLCVSADEHIIGIFSDSAPHGFCCRFYEPNKKGAARDSFGLVLTSAIYTVHSIGAAWVYKFKIDSALTYTGTVL
jgi:hypothetical protein